MRAGVWKTARMVVHYSADAERGTADGFNGWAARAGRLGCGPGADGSLNDRHGLSHERNLHNLTYTTPDKSRYRVGTGGAFLRPTPLGVVD